MEHLMIPVGIAVVTVVIAFSVGILLSLRKNSVSTPSSNFKGTDLGKELSSDLKGSLNRLSLSTEKTAAVSQIVSREVRVQSEKAREELETRYREKVRAKDEAIQAAEKKFINMTQDYLKLGKQRKCTETVVRSVAEGRVVVNENGIAVQVNEAAEKILGKKRHEILGKRMTDLRGKRQMVSYIQHMAHAEEEAIAHFTEDEELRRKIRSGSAVIETESGQTRGIISALPEALQEQEVEDYKMEFIASVTHELRTPLVCIQKSLAALEENDGSAAPDQLKSYLEIAKRNSTKLSNMVNQILDFSRLKSGQMVMHTDLVPVYDLLKEAADDVKTWAMDKKIQIVVEVNDKKLSLEADRERLMQAVTNLISNALKFTPAGGTVTLRAGVAEPSEHFIPDSSVRFIQFEVADTGVGIPQGEAKTIFEKFMQASNRSTDGEKGTGLGLSIVKEIISGHQGKIWLESEEGRGSVFSFVVPQYPLVSAQPAAEA